MTITSVTTGLDPYILSVCLFVFLLGLFSLGREGSPIRQVFSFKILLISVELLIIHAGAIHQDLQAAQTLIVIMLVVESVFMVIALAMIANYYRHFPTGENQVSEGKKQ